MGSIQSTTVKNVGEEITRSSKYMRWAFYAIQIAVVAVFLGRSIQHIFFDAPYRALLWDENWMTPIVQSLLGMSWEDYITNLNIDDAIQFAIRSTGYFYLFLVAVAILIRKTAKWIGSLLLLGSGCLIFLAALYCKEKFFSSGQFFEYSLQFMAPIFLFIVAYTQRYSSRLILAMKIATALTFICHGLYAVGFYPQPGTFVEMTINILQVSETSAKQFLWTAGVVDFIVAAIIFLPWKWARMGLAYIIFWGFMTTIARIWAHFDIEIPLISLGQWSHESIYRIPHFMIPLALFFILKYQHDRGGD